MQAIAEGVCILNLRIGGGKLFEQAKDRPLYVVRRTVNLNGPREDDDGR